MGEKQRSLDEEKIHQLAAIVESSDDAIVGKTLDGTITSWNKAAETIYGYTEAEAIGKPISIVSLPGHEDEVPQILERIKHGEHIVHFETVRKRKDGQIIHVSLSVSPFRNAEGRIVGASTIARDITERKRAEEKLQAASLYARNLIEASLDPLVTISADGKITDVNKATEEVTGVSRQELIGSDFSDYFTEPDKARAGYREVFSKGFVTDYPLAMRHVSGKLTEVLYNASVYRDERGNVAGVFASARDITERKIAIERLQAASLYARNLIEASLDPFVTISADGKITDVNHATEEVTGVTRQRLIGSDFSDYFTEPDKARAGYREVFSRGFVTDYPLAIRHASGKVTDVLYNASVYRDEKGDVAGVFAAARDITERKRAEEKVKLASLYARNLIEASLDPFVTISADGKITDVNKATEEVTGVGRPELIGSDFSDYFTEPDKARAGYREVFSKGFVTDYPLAIRHASGKVTEVLYNASVYRDDKGNVAGVFAAARDITERKRAEEQMVSTVAELQRREHEMMLMNQMNDLLQSCQVSAEGYTLISLSAPVLFEGLSGGLAIFDKSNQVLDTVAQWGENQVLEAVFTLDECWALRAGRLHRIDDPNRGLLCHHFIRPPSGGYIDMPLLVLGEVIGVLHLNAPPGRAIDAAQQALAATFAEMVKLALSNIKLREALREQAVRDPLTKLFNRRYLDETLARELHRAVRAEAPLCVAMLDIDHFKDFNNEYGHEAGDIVLEYIGKVLREKLRGSDLSCRYGGEEFTVIMLGTELPVASQRIEQICQQVRQTRQRYQDTLLPIVTLSVGIAQALRHGSDPEELLRAADHALYAAKRGGRNRIEIFQPA